MNKAKYILNNGVELRNDVMSKYVYSRIMEQGCARKFPKKEKIKNEKFGKKKRSN